MREEKKLGKRPLKNFFFRGSSVHSFENGLWCSICIDRLHLQLRGRPDLTGFDNLEFFFVSTRGLKEMRGVPKPPRFIFVFVSVLCGFFFMDMGIMGHHLSRHIDVSLHPLLRRRPIKSGDKIIMPPSALDHLASLHIDYPMLFELQNDATERMSHCGVLEFIVEEGMIYMPYWMIENMLLQEGDIVRVKNMTLPKGTYVKLQPHTKDFLDISNPKAM
ncbi:hypothetical protein F2P56_025941 [Juglans regia]|uniref:Ubiquitin fusion degradation protein UFD1 N-terminal subdomain 1 domain-containing protein n=1 Tax=Juglans regia TaxID=51240 RepID=A0A833WME3_JUGRE|nr:hypothetical protein F2P56_025941 [Juglans regia]